MITPKRTAPPSRRGTLTAVVVSCLLASLPLAAQTRSPSHPSSDSGGRTAHETGGSYTPPAPSSGSSSSGGSDFRSGSSSSSGSRTRTAVPGSPGSSNPSRSPSRQPSNRRDSHSHFGGNGGRVYYPGYGYYPYGSFWWNVFWGYPYNYDWEYPRYGYGGYDRDRDDSFGALDLDVSPSQTQVFLDGQYIGTVDDFDGWPRYLWLEKGTYDLALYYPGFKTDARQISIYPGLVIDIDDRMEKGESIRPEDLTTKTHDHRDSRQRYESEREQELDRRHDASSDDDRDDDKDHQDEWRSRRRERVIEKREMSEDADGRETEVSDDSGSGTVKVQVDPDDASVYLDGKFIGTGADLQKMAGGLPIEPGDHKLSVVRPGRKDENVNFKVRAGKTVNLEVILEEKNND